MAKKKAKTERYAVTAGGERLRIQKEEGRYFLCGEDGKRRFRKSSVTVETVEAAPAAEEKTTGQETETPDE